jgi:predicted nucleotidyltransferase
MDNERIAFLREKIEPFCHRWKIAEFALFGSVLREDFRSDSDVDGVFPVRLRERFVADRYDRLST